MKEKSKSLSSKFIKLTVMPVLLLEVAILIFTYISFTKNMSGQVGEQLKDIAMITLNSYDSMYKGEFRLIGKNSYVLMKGDNVVNGDFDFIDHIKEDTGADISIFYGNTRFLTTFTDENGRMVGSTSHSMVNVDVLEAGKDKFYDNTLIGQKKCYVYYRPIYDANGGIIGMIEVAKTTKVVSDSIWSSIIPIIAIAALVIVASVSIAVVFTKRLIEPLAKIEKYAEDVKGGNLSAKVNDNVLNRNDEIGRMAGSIMQMQSSIKSLIEEDELTKLHNRRFGEKRLKMMKKEAPNKGRCYSLAIGDIDFFKKVNDTYGHDCGDLVLQNVARVMKDYMRNKGFVIRWGGEEFLLAFDGLNSDDAAVELENLLAEVREIQIPYEDRIVKVTMTFGVVDGNGLSDLELLFKTADGLLYSGKQAGRNRVVSQ